MGVRRALTRFYARRWPLVVPVLALLAVPLATNIGGAAIPDGAGVIHACYGDDHLLRVIDTADPTGTCKALEKPVSWSQTGPPGTNGANGVSAAFARNRALGPSVAAAMAGTYVNVITENLATGFYVILANTEIASDPNQGSDCDLSYDTGGGPVVADHSSQSPAGAASSRTGHNLQRLIQFGTGPATIRLDCRGGAAWNASNSSIISIQVQSATDASFP